MKVKVVKEFYWTITLLLAVVSIVKGSVEEERLIKNMFKGYNKLIRPVRNSSDYVVITMDLVLLQLINVVRIQSNNDSFFLHRFD